MEGEKAYALTIRATLAVCIGAEGHEKARWWSAASLDRYPHRSDRSQRFGTRYVREFREAPGTQGACASWLSDAVLEFGVEPIREQQKYVERLNAPVPRITTTRSNVCFDSCSPSIR